METKAFNDGVLQEVITILKEGGVVAHAADTCFGLLGDAMSPVALSTIQAIKGRDGQKPMSIMLPMTAMSELSSYAELSDFAKDVANKLLPGPVTLLLPKGPAIPQHYFPETNLIGIRVPEDEQTQIILRGFDGPLITTSANTSGQPICFDHEEVQRSFKNAAVKPDLLLEGTCNKHAEASTVLMVGEDHLKIVRPGPITKDYLENVFGLPVKE